MKFKDILSALRLDFMASLRLSWRWFWRTGVISCVLIFAALLIAVSQNPAPDPSMSSPDLLSMVLPLLVFAIPLSLVLALLVGFLRLAWHLAGIWILVPLILIPASLFASFTLMGGRIKESAREFVTACEKAEPAPDNSQPDASPPQSGGVSPGGGLHGMHGGGGKAALVLILVILVYFLATHPILLWQFAILAFWLLAAFFLGFAPAAVASLLALTASSAHRTWRRILREAPVETSGQSGTGQSGTGHP